MHRYHRYKLDGQVLYDPNDPNDPNQGIDDSNIPIIKK
jgi:hypothetical protein